jgi:hypothetical protein
MVGLAGFEPTDSSVGKSGEKTESFPERRGFVSSFFLVCIRRD